ncbi:hypothetical protein J3Q64DRAFT_1646285, partial [Phycomyces blakesleeanus]
LSASTINTSGDVPGPRNYPIVVAIGSHVLMYGGEPIVPDDKWDPNFYILNPSARQWLRIQMEGPVPVERSGHSAFTANGVVYIWGGQRAGRYLDDMLAFNTSNCKLNFATRKKKKKNKCVIYMLFIQILLILVGSFYRPSMKVLLQDQAMFL